jgi:hypothetical protein
VNDVIGDAGFSMAVRLEQIVGGMRVHPIAPFAECMAKGPTMWGQRGFCEEEKIRGVVVQHRNDVDQGMTVGLHLLNDYDKEFEFYRRRGGNLIVVGCWGPSSSGRCGGGVTVRCRCVPL